MIILASIFVATLVIFSSNVNADEFNNFYYEVTNGEVKITGYDGMDNDIVIPSSIKNMPVTAIGEQVFYGGSLTNVVIPESVKTLENGAFSNNKSLKTVKFEGNGIKTIGYGAFNGCDYLDTINFPKSLQTIGEVAFTGCESLKNVDLSKTSINSLGKTAFRWCTILETLKLPNTLSTIPEELCMECTSLKNVVLGTNVKTIGKSAFYHCALLKNINFPNGLKSIEDEAFSCTELKSIKLPNSVSNIAGTAFENSNLETVYCEKGSYAAKFFGNNKEIKVITDANNSSSNNSSTKKKQPKGKLSKYLSDKKLVITVGFSKKLSLVNNTAKVKWNSSNKKVAIITKNGVIKTKKTGKFVVTATEKGKKYKCRVKVVANKKSLPKSFLMKSFSGIELLPTSIQKKGKYYAITFKLRNKSHYHIKEMKSINVKFMVNGKAINKGGKVPKNMTYKPGASGKFTIKYKIKKKVDLRKSAIEIWRGSRFLFKTSFFS